MNDKKFDKSLDATDSNKENETAQNNNVYQGCNIDIKKALEDERDKFIRLSADFENYKKRINKERESYFSEVKCSITKNFLPILDDLERAIQNTTEDTMSLNGIKIIQEKFEGILNKMEIKKIPITLKKDSPDPENHNIIAMVPTKNESEKGKIFEIVEHGYMEKDKVIRVAKIIISE